MSTLARSWVLVTALGYVLLIVGSITATEWAIATEVVALLVVAARCDDVERDRQR
jgi:hypothetical protein